MVAAHFAGDSLRKLAIIKFQDIDEYNIDQLFLKKPGGILIILPKQFHDSVKETQIWNTVYTFIGTPIPPLPST